MQQPHYNPILPYHRHLSTCTQKAERLCLFSAAAGRHVRFVSLKKLTRSGAVVTPQIAKLAPQQRIWAKVNPCHCCYCSCRGSGGGGGACRAGSMVVSTHSPEQRYRAMQSVTRGDAAGRHEVWGLVRLFIVRKSTVNMLKAHTTRCKAGQKGDLRVTCGTCAFVRAQRER